MRGGTVRGGTIRARHASDAQATQGRRRGGDRIRRAAADNGRCDVRRASAHVHAHVVGTAAQEIAVRVALDNLEARGPTHGAALQPGPDGI